MNAEIYDDLKQYVGSKNSYADDLLNMGYTKGKMDGYNQALDDIFNLAKQNAYDDGVDCSIGLRKLDELIVNICK